MALIIRLRQQGRTNRQTYRVVVADKRSPRDGKYIEMLGWYNPFQKENNVQINGERMNFWIGQGAQVSEKVEKLATRAAPEVITDLHNRQHAKQVKLAAKRRAAKKEAAKSRVSKTDSVPGPKAKATAKKRVAKKK